VGPGPKETPGSAARLIVDHVRRRGGDDAVDAVLSRAGLDLQVEELIDESRWVSYDDRIALFDAAAAVFDDPHVAYEIGTEVLDGSVAALVPVLRALGAPGPALQCIVEHATTFCPTATMALDELGEQHAQITYRLLDEHRPSIHDCRYTIGLLTRLGPIFGLPPATVQHAACRVDGADACVYRVSWSLPARTRPAESRRVRRDRQRALTTRFWEIETATPELVDHADPASVLERMEAEAAAAIGASAHVLILTDREGAAPHIISKGLRGGVGALVDDVLQGLVADDDGRRLVLAIESDRRRYGHVVFLFDDDVDGTERPLLAAHARRVAVALDAAAALSDAQLREETASVLLHLSRRLSEITTLEEITRRLVDALPVVTGAQQATVMLWDEDAQALRMYATTGVPERLQTEVDAIQIPLEVAMRDAPAGVGERPALIPRAAARGVVADLMDRHGETFLALVPLLIRDHFQGMMICGWRDRAPLGAHSVLEERLTAIADQAATAMETATLLERVRHQALHDALTGLPNQTLFADRVTSAITRSHRNGTRVGIGVLDLDRFKTVNDSLGHTAGDELLVQVGARLAGAVRSPDTIARMGGDEFTLLFPDLTEGGEAAVAQRILDAFVQPFEIDGHRLRISPSIGIAAYPDDGDVLDQLLKCADVAMYRAKDRGRNTWTSYTSGMAERAHDRLTLETDLYRAVQRHELRVAYQPVLHVANNRIIGSESLVRWAHPTLGLLMPEEFLSIAEDVGLMAEIDGWVLRQACVELGNARATGAQMQYIAVNLSARTLCHPALDRLVNDALTAGGLDATRLVIDISESVMSDGGHAIGDALQCLRERGVRIALDDFGRGGSALSQLEQLPIDQLKVDSRFLANVDDLDAPAPVAAAIVAMGHGLGIDVVAAGGETEVQRAVAARLGFDLVQGWHVGRPATALDYAGARSRTA